MLDFPKFFGIPGVPPGTILSLLEGKTLTFNFAAAFVGTFTVEVSSSDFTSSESARSESLSAFFAFLFASYVAFLLNIVFIAVSTFASIPALYASNFLSILFTTFEPFLISF